MKMLSIDIETYSSANLQQCGVYRYAEAPDFEIMLFAYCADGSPVRVVDLTCGERIPEEVLDALTDKGVTKWAFNASFERICLSRHMKDLGLPLDPRHDDRTPPTERARGRKAPLLALRRQEELHGEGLARGLAQADVRRGHGDRRVRRGLLQGAGRANLRP